MAKEKVNEKAIEQLKIARCAFSAPEMRVAFARAIEALEVGPCLNCRDKIAENVNEKKGGHWIDGYSEGYHRALEEHGLTGEITPEEIKKAVQSLQNLIDLANDTEENEDIYTDENGNRFVYLSMRDLKAIRTAITTLLAENKAPKITADFFGKKELEGKWECVIESVRRI